MKYKHALGIALCLLTMVIGIPRAGQAQQQSGISGTVRDSTGGTIPGAAVTISSPALIEQSREAVTDSGGLYSFIDLRPGVYRVEFTLPGFSRVTREGVQLTSGFTATVDAELSLASVQEEITVRGGAPIVDVNNVVRQQVVSREVMDAIPTARNINAYAALIPGREVERRRRRHPR